MWYLYIDIDIYCVCVYMLLPRGCLVGEMASMKRCKLWKTGEDGLCCSSSAIQTRLGSSSLLEERSETPIVYVVSFVLSATPQTEGNGQGI